jgi:hypothetical protein
MIGEGTSCTYAPIVNAAFVTVMLGGRVGILKSTMIACCVSKVALLSVTAHVRFQETVQILRSAGSSEFECLPHVRQSEPLGNQVP